jgi:copper oxidase (laccase) domain-containing protein
MAVAPATLMAWLGPAIGPAAFEVGPEVRQGFLAAADSPGAAACFAPNAARPGYYFADLYALARLRLDALGITRIFGGDCCTFSDSERFFSYRRDGVTGRMASVILLNSD